MKEMRRKAEILFRIRELESVISDPDQSSEDYNLNLGRLRALNWVLNKD